MSHLGTKCLKNTLRVPTKSEKCFGKKAIWPGQALCRQVTRHWVAGTCFVRPWHCCSRRAALFSTAAGAGRACAPWPLFVLRWAQCHGSPDAGPSHFELEGRSSLPARVLIPRARRLDDHTYVSTWGPCRGGGGAVEPCSARYDDKCDASHYCHIIVFATSTITHTHVDRRE